LQIEIGILRLRPRPRGKRADDIVAEQHHQVIALGENHETRRRSDPPDDVRHRIRMAGERTDIGRQLRHQRLGEVLVGRHWRGGRCRPRGGSANRGAAQCAAKECAPPHHVATSVTIAHAGRWDYNHRRSSLPLFPGRRLIEIFNPR
jgi:hypothetical protein